jgi:hypothetical protein
MDRHIQPEQHRKNGPGPAWYERQEGNQRELAQDRAVALASFERSMPEVGRIRVGEFG